MAELLRKITGGGVAENQHIAQRLESTNSDP